MDLAWRNQYVGVLEMEYDGVKFYFIDNEYYFCGEKPYGEIYQDIEKFAFFSKAALSALPLIGFRPDVIHCHGWMTALTPLYVKKVYSDDPFFSSSKMVYSLYEDKFKKMFSKEFSEKLMMDGISDEDVALIKQKEVSYEDLTKLASDFSDAVIVGTENVDTSLIDYTKEQNKKLLEYVEDYVQPYISLYKSL